FANPASANLIGAPIDQIIGKNVHDLVNEGLISESCSLEVLKKRKPVSILQRVRDGRTVLATGVPIFDDDHDEIILIITTSKDVDEINHLLLRLERQEKELLHKDEAIEDLRADIFASLGFVTGDDSMRSIKDMVARIAPLDVTVLIEGETGVGKEVIARSLHRFSNRRNQPFVKINCSIIPENLVEAELFGYEGGAYTGARKEGKRGKVELADGGTLFLDEIGEMPLTTQVKLLEFIQDGTFSRVSGTSRNKVDLRIVAATNADLKALCERGMFRKDLYFRLNVIPVHIPPLRERVDDIRILSRYFLKNLNAKYKMVKTLDSKASDALMAYAWPGNVRELEHIMEHAYVLCDGDRITYDIMDDIIRVAAPGNAMIGSIDMELRPLKEVRAEVEQCLARKAYDLTGSTYKAAKLLQVDQSTVARILKKSKT
ncbi:MAG: sigma 54-interacting transcriptional regulator, partial [Clostridiales Family XIII bacterium]|nr:sigma 54-interacting transcriptional regulator [Clostridiales Family XIII bacterium]